MATMAMERNGIQVPDPSQAKRARPSLSETFSSPRRSASSLVRKYISFGKKKCGPKILTIMCGLLLLC